LVQGDARFCWSHDPAHADKRSRAASIAAKAKSKNNDIHDVRNRLKALADDVLEGRVDKGKASVAAQVLGVYIRACEQGRKQRQVEELEVLLEDAHAEIQRLEAERSSRWGLRGI
jgi:hypothetical protein